MLLETLYRSPALVSCFDDAADQAAADKAAADSAAAALAALSHEPKTFTQDEVNKILAEDKRKHQATLLKTESSFKDLLANSQNLSAKERSTLEENLATVQGQLRTKEETAKMEKKQLEEQLTGKIEEHKTRAVEWETRYKTETVSRSLQDAAIKAEAFQSSQIVALLTPMTRLVEMIDEKTNKSTGKFRPVVDFPDVDADGNPTITVRTPEEAVKRMKDLPETYGNLFKSNVVSGIGANSSTGIPTGANGKVNVKNLSPEQFRELLKTNPAALGLNPKSQRSGRR
jgi:flagellar motility protein MotE (MotC chaperone)